MCSIKQVIAAILGTSAASIIMAKPAEAQYSIVGEQPAVGPLHLKEAQLLKQLNKDYQLGLIDPFELANMTRDLDAIRVREEAYRMGKQGMTVRAAEKISKKLAGFQADLDRRSSQAVAAIQ